MLKPQEGDQTRRLQTVLDACAARGGGKVELAAGSFETGTLFLRSGVELSLSPGATLKASPHPELFPLLDEHAMRFTGDGHGVRAMIAGLNVRDIALTGGGEIVAAAAGFASAAILDETRPRGIHLENCENVRVDDLRLRDSCFWMLLALGCRHVAFSRLSIWNHAMPNSDGIDIVGCSDVRIEDCQIDCDDDGICLKSGTTRATRRVRVSGCRVFTHCNALKVGTETNSDVEDIHFENCELGASSDTSRVHFGSLRGLSGVCLGMVDGGSLRRARFQGLRMSGFESPIFLKLGLRNRPIPDGHPPERLDRERSAIEAISLEDIVCREAGSHGSMAMGLPGRPIRDLRLLRVHIDVVGPHHKSDGNPDLAARANEYPDSRHFGPAPAWGFFCAHVEGLIQEDCRFSWQNPDEREQFRQIDTIAALAT